MTRSNKISSRQRKTFSTSAPSFEAMEGRRMMSVVTATGTNNADTIIVRQSGVNVSVQINGTTRTYANQPVSSVRVDGLGGDDLVTVSSGITLPVNVYGGDGNDNISGGSGSDVIDGGAGNDSIRGNGGNDTIHGQSGNDTILSGNGNDMVHGGQGDDALDGENGNDYVNGNGQASVVVGVLATQLDASTARMQTFAAGAVSKAAGAVSKAGAISGNSIHFWTDNDVVRGGAGNDVVDGADGNDAVYGGQGEDELWGGDGNDRLYGGADNNRLIGGKGDDVLVTLGGGTRDLAWGQAGNDSFWMDDARTTELAMDGEAAEFAGSNFHFVQKFQTLTVNNGGGVTNDHRAESKELNGQNFIDPIASTAYRNFSSMPLFAPDGAKADDIKQGAAGDCYFMAGLSAVARANANHIRQSVVDLGDGTYAVRFFQSGVAKFFRVDGDLPASSTTSGGLTYAKLGHGNSTWVAIMEKAFAYFRSNAGTYASIDVGYLREPYNAMGLTNNHFFGSGAQQVLSNISYYLGQGKAVTTLTPATAPTNGAPVIPFHVYSVASVNLGANTITLRNPHGTDGAGNDGNNDGYVTMTGAQFAGYFIEARWSNVA